MFQGQTNFWDKQLLESIEKQLRIHNLLEVMTAMYAAGAIDNVTYVKNLNEAYNELNR